MYIQYKEGIFCGVSQNLGKVKTSGGGARKRAINTRNN